MLSEPLGGRISIISEAQRASNPAKPSSSSMLHVNAICNLSHQVLSALLLILVHNAGRPMREESSHGWL